MKRLLTYTAALSLAVTLGACTTDAPTDLGGSLLSSDDLVTFEVLLPASEFLVFDTAFSGYAKAANSPFEMIAQKLEGVVDAHALFRMTLPPVTVSVRTTGTTVVADSSPKFFSGRMVLKLDTLITHATEPVKLRLFRTVEEWDATATWTQRIDSGTVHLPWSTPGGTRGAQIDTATWAAGDSVVFTVDSATLAQWNDTTNKARGALVVSETDGSRIEVLSTVMHVSTHSSLRADTVINVDLVPSFRTFISNPTLPTSSSNLRVGGLPAWRSILKFRPDLRDRPFTCPARANCEIKLDSVHVSIAQLILTPTSSPAGFTPEDTVVIDARTLAPNSAVPLERSALGSHTGYSQVLAPSLFNGVSTETAKIDITTFIRHQTDDAVKDEDRLPPILALIQVPEPHTFGFAAFQPNIMLRLVLTATLGRQP